MPYDQRGKPKQTHTPGRDLAVLIAKSAKSFGIPISTIFEACGLNRSTFSRWRSGKTNPNTITCERVNKALEELDPAK